MKIQDLDPILQEAGGYVARNAKEAADPRWSMSIGGDVTTHTMRNMMKAFYPSPPQKGEKQTVVKESKVDYKNIYTEDKLTYIGNCTDDECIADIFGDATEFAQVVDQQGDEFEIGDLVVKYDDEEDIHSFYLKEAMSPEACCGKPVTECKCGAECEHCDCFEVNNKVNANNRNYGMRKASGQGDNPMKIESSSHERTLDYINKLFDGLTDAEKVDIQRQLTVKVRGISVPPISPNLKLKDRDPNDDDIADMPLSQLKKRFNSAVKQ